MGWLNQGRGDHSPQSLDRILAILFLASKPARQDIDPAESIHVGPGDAYQPATAGIIKEGGRCWIEGQADSRGYFIDVLPARTGGMHGFKGELGFRYGYTTGSVAFVKGLTKDRGLICIRHADRLSA